VPKFLTVSPTHVSGKKEYAWNNFRSGEYVAIGWLSDYDLTGKSLDEIISLIRKERYDNEVSAIDAFTKFLALDVNDYVGVNNTNDGLFGIGVISSGYRYQKDKHDTGSDEGEFYSHFREVKWKYTNYVKRRDLIGSEETGWRPYGTVGNLYDEVPPYVLRLLGKMPPTHRPKTVAPDYLKAVIGAIERLKSDPNHQERAHESLVEDFFCAIGYEKHQNIKYRQGRVDISIWHGDRVLVVLEVKKDWNLSLYNSPETIKQAYKYALDQGGRYVIMTNGDYYAIFDRLKGLSLSSNLIGEFRLTALEDEDVSIIQRMSHNSLVNPNIEELFRYLSECFEQ
jgi:Holliday junction resolvase-like predicted endonuclease